MADQDNPDSAPGVDNVEIKTSSKDVVLKHQSILVLILALLCCIAGVVLLIKSQTRNDSEVNAGSILIMLGLIIALAGATMYFSAQARIKKKQ